MIRALFHLRVPLGYMLQNWEIFSYVHVNERKLYFCCNSVYAQYSLRSGEQRPLMAWLLYQSGSFGIAVSAIGCVCLYVNEYLSTESKSAFFILILLKIRHENVSR